uniref:Uncharacterized protein n=1 Tax=viral metagenome TaxID=1070528 RepID=A0A6C0J3E5_9ZZZZ
MDKHTYLIEILTSPLDFLLKNTNEDIIIKWRKEFLELYNNRRDYLYNNTKIIVKNNFLENYNLANIKLNHLSINQNPWKYLETEDHTILELNDTREVSVSHHDSAKQELLYHTNIKDGVNQIVTSLFQYLSYFEENDISTNIWNYCLTSMNFSIYFFILGILILSCQYTWTILLITNVSDDFKLSRDSSIILITIISTIISLLYSYKNIYSYNKTRKCYKYLIKIYNDYPSVQLSELDKKHLHFNQRNITMKKWIVKFNWWTDFLSNGLLPIIIPFLNIFVILSSEDLLDAILNSIAIFFIIQIDEDLYSINEWEKEKNTVNSMRWLLSCIYTSNFPVFDDVFRKEYNNWQSRFLQFKKRTSKKIFSSNNYIRN